MKEPYEDLRDANPGPQQPQDLEPLDPPEPLVVPPDELREQQSIRDQLLRQQAANVVNIHVAEHVRLHSYSKVFAFMRLHMRTYRYARNCAGFGFGGIKGRWWSKQFWTYTVWNDREDMMSFVTQGPHAEAVSRIGEFAAPGSCYVEWESNQDPDWSEAMKRLANPTRYFI